MNATMLSQRFNWIQAARFWAALAIIFYHVAVHLRNFFAPHDNAILLMSNVFLRQGVYLFFSISGFVMARALSSGKPLQFIRDRFLRIYPPFWLAVGLTFAVDQLVLGHGPDSSHLFRALTLLPCEQISYPLGIEWTLIYEVFFYAIVGILIAIRHAALQGAFIVIWCFSILLQNMLAPERPLQFLPNWSYIVLSPFNLTFIAGMAVFRFRQKTWEMRGILWFLFVVGDIVYQGMGPALPGCWAVALLAVVWGSMTALLIGASMHKDLSSSHLFVRWGDWSYGMYLIHVPVILLIYGWFYSRQPLKIPHLLLGTGTALIAIVLGMGYGKLEHSLHRRISALVRSKKPELLLVDPVQATTPN